MQTSALQHPILSELTPGECAAMLGRNHVGRLAFTSGAEIDIEPVHYVRDRDWLFMRSAAGSKLTALAHAPFAAFEVDEIYGAFDWRSVVAHGTIYRMRARGSPVDRAAFDRALRALKSFVPETLTEDDPTPLRRTVYGLHVDRVSGRAASYEQHKAPGR